MAPIFVERCLTAIKYNFTAVGCLRLTYMGVENRVSNDYRKRNCANPIVRKWSIKHEHHQFILYGTVRCTDRLYLLK